MEKEKTEEPKVKQVKFQQEDNPVEDKSPKKHRKRSKGVLNALKSQMEFYFGDSNMSKDRFMKQQMEEYSDGYLPLSMFFNFNKIKEVTDDMEMLIKAVQISKLLQLNEDKTKVKRTTPPKYLTQEDMDARTVYVEGLPKTMTHELLNSIFSTCGKVTYVSLPRYKSTKDIKGFAFVEMESPEEAAKAVDKLNRAPQLDDGKLDEKVGGSMKESTNVKYLKKRLANEGAEVGDLDSEKKELTASEQEGSSQQEGKDSTKSKSKKKKKKRRSNLLNPETTEGYQYLPETDAPLPGADQMKKAIEAKQIEASSDTDDTKVKKSKKSKKKRKHSVGPLVRAAEDVPQQVSETHRDSSDSAKKPKRHPEDSSESEGQGSKKRRQPAEETPQHSEAKICKKDENPEESTGDVGGDKSQDSEKDTKDFTKDSKDVAKDVKDSSEISRDSSQIGENLTGDGKESGSKRESSRKRKKQSTDSIQEKETISEKQPTGKVPRRISDQQSNPTALNEGGKRKRKSFETSDDGNRKRQRLGSESAAEDTAKPEEEASSKKKRRRKRTRDTGERILLRVMAKKDWSRLKQEYLNLQRTNMLKLKEQLKEVARQKDKNDQNNSQKNTENNSPTNKDTQKNPESGDRQMPPKYVPNVILEVKSDVAIYHKTFKLEEFPNVEISYIDVKEGSSTGHVRCKDPESALNLLNAHRKGYSFSLVTGEAEKAYWDKLVLDREARLSNNTRQKRRGKNKLLHRAQNPLVENFMGQHLMFNTEEDDEGNPAAISSPKITAAAEESG